MSRPVGLYFLPGRNNSRQGEPDCSGATPWEGNRFASRSLIWGALAPSFYASDTLSQRGGFPEAAQKPVGRLHGRRWVHLAMTAKTSQLRSDDIKAPVPDMRLVVGRLDACTAAFQPGMSPQGFGFIQKAVALNHWDDPADPNHIRFGEVSAAHCMNYTADATFANLLVAGRKVENAPAGFQVPLQQYLGYFKGTESPAAYGRYQKENGAVFVSAKLPAGIRPLKATWTALLPVLRFDRENNLVPPGSPDGWPDAQPANDQFGAAGVAGADARHDVRVDLELWDDRGASPDARVATLTDPAASNAVPGVSGRLYYKAVFVNDWDAATRLNHPLDVSPFLDDVTVTYQPPGGARILSWEIPGS